MKFVKIVPGAILLALLSLNSLQAGPVLDRIISENLIKVATDPNWPPQSFINDDNKMEGFDVDVAREIARRLGVEIEFTTPSWDAIITGNWNRRWDIHVGSMMPTRERSRKLRFPAVYYFTPAAVAVHVNSQITRISELSGKKIGAETDTDFESYLQKSLIIDAEGAPKFDFQINNANINTYENSMSALDDLRLGDGVQLSGVISSMPIIMKAIEKGYQIKILDNPVFYQPLAVAIEPGDIELNEKLKDIIGWMGKDGSLTAISKNWYGIDYTVTR